MIRTKPTNRANTGRATVTPNARKIVPPMYSNSATLPIMPPTNTAAMIIGITTMPMPVIASTTNTSGNNNFVSNPIRNVVAGRCVSSRTHAATGRGMATAINM